MHKRLYRGLMIAGMFLAGSYLFASGSLGCGSLASEAAISSTDMCFIFDCTNGIFGGLIDPCANVYGTDTGNPEQGQAGTFAGPSSGPFFADCPTDETTGGG